MENIGDNIYTNRNKHTNAENGGDENGELKNLTNLAQQDCDDFEMFMKKV